MMTTSSIDERVKPGHKRDETTECIVLNRTADNSRPNLSAHNFVRGDQFILVC